MSENLITLCCPIVTVKNKMPAQRLSQDGKCGACKQPLFTGLPVPLRQQQLCGPRQYRFALGR